ncbi:MAG: glycine--tRNA ligase subunit beta [Nitrospirae bacterium]|nr:glycine--tRNA ligase subunit beta [Nitrospirota bacterium]
MTQDHHSLLLEIGTEDIPARFLPGAINDLQNNSSALLKDNSISFKEIKVYATPRRLVLLVSGLPEMQIGSIREVFGPPKKIAFDENGNPTDTAFKFACSQGVNVESLIIKKREKGEYVVSIIEEKGKPVKELLPEILKKIIFSIRFPKTMRWGNRNIRFARPIHWLLAIFNNEIIPFELDGIKSSNMTYGHRFLSPAKFQVKEIASFKSLLENNSVIVDNEDRKKRIIEGIRGLSSSVGGIPVEDEELIETVNFLVEYPFPVICSFNEDYLQLPKELLITVMKDHQKFFAIQDNQGKLINHFIVVSNTREENVEVVRIGAERVIKARFEDARFYFEKDKKKKLYERTEELKKVIYHERLKSLYEKTERIVSLVEFISEKVIPSKRDKVIRAAWLSKTDLITGVVKEFPELQGIIGKYYALYDGENVEVARGIEEQYLPKHSGGGLPDTDVGCILSIADKIDNIVSFFSLGLIPTGSEDPFALRRQALGIIAILLEKQYSLPLKNLILYALNNLKTLFLPPENMEDKICLFFKHRFETVFSDMGYDPDVIQSVLYMSLEIPVKEVENRAYAIRRFKKEKFYDNFLLAIKRVHNILPKEKDYELKKNLLTAESEKVLKNKIDAIRPELNSLIKGKGYFEAILLLTTITEPINHFFDNVLVMDKNEDIRENRLALLKEVWDTAISIADFSRLQGFQYK